VAKLEVLDNLSKIGEIDKSGMLEVVASTPEMLRDAEERAKHVSLPKIKKIKQVVIAGMGGSAISGNIICDLYGNTAELPIWVNRNYSIPGFVNHETLFLALSYSGNTEETLRALFAAAKRQAQIVCVTSGGKLKEIAQEKGYPLFLIPSGYQPRVALPYLLLPVLATLETFGVIPSFSGELSLAISLLEKLKLQYAPQKPLRANRAKELAKKLVGKIPVVFAVSGTTGAAALRLKAQLNENSKVAALFNLFPELNHNEIVGLSLLKRVEHNFSLLFLRDEKDSERIKKRIEITKSLIGRQLGGVNEVWAEGNSALARILSLIYFGDFLTVYLAILRGIDPTPVGVIERLKRELMR